MSLKRLVNRPSFVNDQTWYSFNDFICLSVPPMGGDSESSPTGPKTSQEQSDY